MFSKYIPLTGLIFCAFSFAGVVNGLTYASETPISDKERKTDALVMPGEEAFEYSCISGYIISQKLYASGLTPSEVIVKLTFDTTGFKPGSSKRKSIELIYPFSALKDVHNLWLSNHQRDLFRDAQTKRLPVQIKNLYPFGCDSGTNFIAHFVNVCSNEAECDN